MDSFGFIFYHGWGYNMHYYDKLKSKLSGPIVLWDSGYYGNVVQDMPRTNDVKWFGIGHSVGFVKLVLSGLNFAGMVSLQGCCNFLSKDTKLAKVRRRSLTEIRKQFVASPGDTLRQFYSSCGFGYGNVVEEMKIDLNKINTHRLLSDLDLLQEEVTLLECPLCVIAAQDDMIVPLDVMQDNFRDETRFYVSKTGGHGLGYNQREFVFSVISEFVDECIKRSNP